MKHVYLWTALTIAALVTAIALWGSSPPHYPKVIVGFPENITLTFIEQPWSSQEKCGRENDAISAKVRGKCPNCRIKASCPTRLNAAETNALRGKAIDIPVVYTASEIIMVKAEARQATKICDSMAKQITEKKSQQANCIVPMGR